MNNNDKLFFKLMNIIAMDMGEEEHKSKTIPTQSTPKTIPKQPEPTIIYVNPPVKSSTVQKTSKWPDILIIIATIGFVIWRYRK